MQPRIDACRSIPEIVVVSEIEEKVNGDLLEYDMTS